MNQSLVLIDQEQLNRIEAKVENFEKLLKTSLRDIPSGKYISESDAKKKIWKRINMVLGTKKKRGDRFFKGRFN